MLPNFFLNNLTFRIPFKKLPCCIEISDMRECLSDQLVDLDWLWTMYLINLWIWIEYQLFTWSICGSGLIINDLPDQFVDLDWLSTVYLINLWIWIDLLVTGNHLNIKYLIYWMNSFCSEKKGNKKNIWVKKEKYSTHLF